MNANRLYRLLLLFYTCSCAGRASDRAVDTIKDRGIAVPVIPALPLGAGKVTDTVICRTDPAQSYALYIPAKGNKEALPIIYFFDPHAAGSLPLEKYKSLADAYGFILIGSNNSKNGNDWPTTENTWRCLFDDTQARLRINQQRIYTCGFSGGAKAAGYVALQHPGIKGVIANGAGLPDGVPAGDLPFSFTAIAGEGDMNLTDLVAFDGDLDKTRTLHRMIVFDGRHEWAPESSMNTALAGLQFDAMKEGLLPKDATFIAGYIAESKKRFAAYTKANRLIKAGQECRLSIGFLDGLTDEAGWFQEKAAALDNNVLYQKQKQEQAGLLVREREIKAGYGQHFQENDRPYWERTIRVLQAGVLAKTAESAMQQRLLAYLSLAFYSFSNRMISANENQEARHFVELYKMADPFNSEAWYFSAILHARDHQPQATEGDLQKAVSYGFRDRSRLEQQPELKSLSAAIDLAGIESRMRVPFKGH